MVMSLYWDVRLTLWRGERAQFLSLVCSLRSSPGRVDRPWGFLEGCAGSETLILMLENQSICASSCSLLTSCTCHTCSPSQVCPRIVDGTEVRRTWGWFSSHLSLLSPSLICSQIETMLFKPSCVQWCRWADGGRRSCLLCAYTGSQVLLYETRVSPAESLRPIFLDICLTHP